MAFEIPVIPFDGCDAGAFIQQHITRSKQDDASLRETVDKIVNDVRINGDTALFNYTEQFDKIRLSADTVKVSEQEIENACAEVSPELMAVLARAAERIRQFHNRQKQNSWLDSAAEGEWLGQMIRPVSACGVYVPGGKAAYPSSMLMNIIPAKVAGVENVIIATPCDKNGVVSSVTLAAARVAGVTDVYKIGGAQAIAAMAFGTASIPRVDKIVGPGNIYVTLAKRAVFGYAGIDSLAGPSEIAIIADETANPAFVAADLLSQAEHDERAAAVLITDSRQLAEAVQIEIAKQAAQLDRSEIIAASLKNNGKILLTQNLRDAVRLSDIIAPEHLEISTKEPFQLLTRVKNAGAVFLGHYTPEPLGDYMAGPSHVLPTETTARFFSPLSVDDFVKKTSVLSFDKAAMERLQSDVILFAEAEGFTAHANAVRIRTGGGKE